MNDPFVVFQDFFWVMFGPILFWLLTTLIVFAVVIAIIRFMQRIQSMTKGGK